MKTATQTVVEIAGYSTIGTYTTTFLAPVSSSSYSAIRTVTTTSSELLVPSSGTLTLTGHLPPSARSFPTMDAQERGLIQEPAKNRSGVMLAYRSPAMSSGWDDFTGEPTGPSPDLTGAAIKSVQFLSDGGDTLIQAESIRDHTKSSSTNVLVITVTNTYSITRTSEHKHKTISNLETSTSWLVGSQAASNTTHYLPAALTVHNTSAVFHATTMMSKTTNTMVHTASLESSANIITGVTGAVTPTSTSGGCAIFSGLALHVFLAILAVRLLFVV
ncbi:hypothetical protein N0V82_004997 [Gnomoniopsis sp. IMI 355080]|nr:hypothetical protein N0V82_004997 [Gnomoniopsis sp. IMI 355080]